MKDLRIEDREKIHDIIFSSSRLRYVLSEHYGVTEERIRAVRVDGDNFKVDIFAEGSPTLRFKAKGLDHVLLRDADSGNMVLRLDPALAQAMYEIVSDYF